MKNHRRSGKWLSCALETLENRRMLAAPDMIPLIDLDLVRQTYPTVRGQNSVVVIMDSGYSEQFTNAQGQIVDNPRLVMVVDNQRISKLWVNDDPLGDENGDGNWDDDGDGLTDNTNGWNYYNNTRNISDNNGHGTAVAGVIASNPFTYQNVQYEGIAPDVQILPIKIAGQNGDIVNSWQRLNDAFRWVYLEVTQRDTPIVAINMSWGFFNGGVPDDDDYTRTDATHPNSIQYYVQQLRAEGVFIAQAAGNSGNQFAHRPGIDNDVFVVGSLNNNDGVNNIVPWVNPNYQPDQNLPNYDPDKGSNYGPSAAYIDLYAPGYWPLVNNAPYNSNDAQYQQEIYLNDGRTSFVVPFVTAAAVLLKTVDPDMPVGDESIANSIFRILQQSSIVSVNDSRSGSTWTDRVLDLDTAVAQALAQTPAGTRGTFNDIEYDSSGNLHMAWFNSSAQLLLYAKRPAGGSFGTTQVNDAGAAFGGAAAAVNGLGTYVALAVDSGGVPAVAYYDNSNADLRFARQSGTTWNREIVDSVNTVGLYPSLAYNGTTPGISYYYANLGNLRFTEKSGTSWSSPQLIDGANQSGRYSRLAVHPGSPDWAVVYEEFVGGGSTYAKYAERTGASWNTTQVELLTQAVAYTDLDFNSANEPAFTYYDSANGDLHFARRSGSSWATDLVVGNGTIGLHTNLWWDAADSGWEIVYYRKSGIETVFKIRGTLNSWGTPRILVQGGGANLSAAWKADGSLSYTGLPTSERDLNVWEGAAN